MTKLALFAAPALAIALSACATVPTSPVVDSDRDIASRNALVPFNQPVWVSNGLIATPTGLVEDSRCPENARCIHAGRAVVETRLDGIGWRQTVELELGKPYTVRGETVMLGTVQPENKLAGPTPIREYRFGFE